MAFALEKDKHYTYKDYLTWPDDVRCEIIDGQVYMMTPAPILMHQNVAGEIFRQAANALAGKTCRALIAPLDVRLPQHNEAEQDSDIVVQPDVMVVCDQNKLDRRGVRGAPDWVVEVLSPKSASRDQIEKRRIYERHGVLEYWLVHPTDRVLTIYRLENGEYGKPDIFALQGSTPVSVLPGISIDWEALVPYLNDDENL
jgi:Uma2 family endonuclease